MYLKNVNLAFLLTVLSVSASAYAGQQIDKTFGLDNLLADWVVIAIIAVFSLSGGVGSNFIKTDADEFVSHAAFAKTFIGFFLGLAVGLTLYGYYNLSVYLLTIPVIVSSSLGCAILVFYMRWFSSPETQKKMREKLNRASKLVEGKTNESN